MKGDRDMNNPETLRYKFLCMLPEIPVQEYLLDEIAVYFMIMSEISSRLGNAAEIPVVYLGKCVIITGTKSLMKINISYGQTCNICYPSTTLPYLF